MPNKNKITLLDSNTKSGLNMDAINENSKKTLEKEGLPVNTSIIQIPKSLKHLNLCSNLQSTPKTRNFKSEVDSRTIMNLSPITATTSVKTNLKSHQNIYQQELIADDNILLNELYTTNQSNNNEHQIVNKLKKDETVKNHMYENIMIDSPILHVNLNKNNENNIKAENAKRCLFEKDKSNSTLNLDTDQDSLNISLDILEQVCQMSEMMDGSTEEIKVENNTNKKKNKLSLFLYGNNSTILEEIEEENELLQLALSMEDNLLTEIKSKNSICSDGEFTSLTQLTNMETNLSNTESKKHKNAILKNNISNYEYAFLNCMEINDISNTLMCEIADITEPLEHSFDEQWTQQYMKNESNISNKKMLNYSSPYSSQETFTTDQILKLSHSYLNHEVDEYNRMSRKRLIKLQPMLNNELNESSTITKDKHMNNLNICKGFSTAGGKSIDISDQALKKVQSVFKDELNELTTITKDKPVANSTICQGFSTAGGKSIDISDQALKKVQSVFKDELNELTTITKDKPVANSSICQGFSTAGGKSIDISDQALKKVQSVFKDELIESTTIIKDKHMNNLNICKGFSTAGGKSIDISDQALKKVQSVFKDELNELTTITKDKPVANSSICQGFSIAGDKSIDISDQALKKVQSVFTDELNELTTITKDKPVANSSICQGFSTAGGKSIDISDQALKKVQSVFKDEFIESLTIIKDKHMNNLNICKGFSTAGGKSIDISDQALKKVQSVFKDELNELTTITKDKPVANSSICQGFSIAGDKSIDISDQALKKVQSVFTDELNELTTITKDKPVANSSICQGFSTAGGKSIDISDQALKKVQSVFTDELNELTTITKDKHMINLNICKGFSTAGGKSFDISDQALKKVQSVFKDELIESTTITKDKPIANSSICQGFLNAGSKSINISDQALKKVQSVFKDELIESTTITKDKPIANSSICQGFSNAGSKSINISDQPLKMVQSVFKNELDESSTKDKFIANSSVCQSFSTDKAKSIKFPDRVLQKHQLGLFKDKCFENSKNEEDCTLEDLSLIDIVEKYERENSVHEPVLNNKRSGSPIFEINHKIKKKVEYDSGWENCVLKSSFNEYLVKKLRGPKISLPEATNWNSPKLSFLDNDLNGILNKLNYDNNALNLMLHWKKNYKLSDGSINKKYSFQDIRNLFLSHDLVDNKLIPKRWIENHFCLIIRKLAATEISFPDHFSNTLLTAKNVIHQLLYRYYREIEKCQRSALKKILEKDETATKRIILCVSKIIKTNIAEKYDIELTDGWYSVHGQVDYEMNKLLHQGIVKVGTKLMIHNAELIGAGEGINPLEIHDGVKLKISTNSTRRARWHARLGFYKNSSLPIPVSLESVLPQGGIIGSLSLVILRKYPMMYLEKKKNSKSILRNEKMEDIEAEKYKVYQQKSLEIIANKIKTEMVTEMKTTTKSKQYLLSIKKDDLDKLSIEELSNIIDNSDDPLDIQSLLKQDKLEALKHFKKSEHERFYNELQNRVNKVFIDQFKDARKVIPLFKLRVVDKKYATTGYKAAMLTIWNPLEDVLAVLNKHCEGQFCTIHYLTSNGFINGELQISANKNTRFDFQGFTNEYAKRDVVLCFKSICTGTFLPLFGELDFVGIVISEVYKTNNIYNEIYVSDKEMNIVSILFRGDIKHYGCDNIYSGNIISGMNIQFRGFNTFSNELSVPKLYNTELSSFTTIPRTELLLDIFNDYKMFMNNSENQDFLICCQKKLVEIKSKNVEIPVTSNASCTRKQSLHTLKNSFCRSYGESSVTVEKTSNTSQSEFSPAQKRIKLLSSYGKTPPLNIVHTKPPDKILMSQFKTPTRL